MAMPIPCAVREECGLMPEERERGVDIVTLVEES